MAPSDSTSVQNNYIIEEPLAALAIEKLEQPFW
jgi:hypothetical protein